MKKNKVNIKNRYFRHFISLFLVVVITIGLAVGRYVEVRNKSALYAAENFYFESDVLSTNASEKNYVYKTGVNEITITLKNYIDELRTSSVAIKYRVSITDTAGKSVTDTKGNTISAITGTLKKYAKAEADVTFSNLKTGTYVVTAVAEEPYAKIIEGTFLITEVDNSIYYSVNDADDSPVVQLTVRTAEYYGNITISWPKGLAPDSTDKLLSSANGGFNAGSTDVSFKANSEYIFQFFKEDPNALFKKADFKVERK